MESLHESADEGRGRAVPGDAGDIKFSSFPTLVSDRYLEDTQEADRILQLRLRVGAVEVARAFGLLTGRMEWAQASADSADRLVGLLGPIPERVRGVELHRNKCNVLLLPDVFLPELRTIVRAYRSLEHSILGPALLHPAFEELHRLGYLESFVWEAQLQREGPRYEGSGFSRVILHTGRRNGHHAFYETLGVEPIHGFHSDRTNNYISVEEFARAYDVDGDATRAYWMGRFAHEKPKVSGYPDRRYHERPRDTREDEAWTKDRRV